MGGSGKQSLTRLAAYVSGLEVFQVQLRKGYSIGDLKVRIYFIRTFEQMVHVVAKTRYVLLDRYFREFTVVTKILNLVLNHNTSTTILLSPRLI